MGSKGSGVIALLRVQVEASIVWICREARGNANGARDLVLPEDADHAVEGSHKLVSIVQEGRASCTRGIEGSAPRGTGRSFPASRVAFVHLPSHCRRARGCRLGGFCSSVALALVEVLWFLPEGAHTLAALVVGGVFAALFFEFTETAWFGSCQNRARANGTDVEGFVLQPPCRNFAAELSP